MNRKEWTGKFQAAVVLAVSLMVSGLLAEGVLQLLSDRRYYVWPPNITRTFHPLAGVMPGIAGASYFHTSSLGIRGEEFADDQDYRILTIGGSTTECLYLDQTETWPFLVQQVLNGQRHSSNVWVGNIGKAGHSTRDHILQVQELFPQYPRIDAIVLLIGINDLGLRLRRDVTWRPLKREPEKYHLQLWRHAFTISPMGDADYPWYKRTEL